MRTDFGLAAIALAATLLGGCGYVGDPLPPAANIPKKILDLTAVQRGDKILVSFTAPTATTEGLAFRRPPALEVRISPEFPDGPSFPVVVEDEKTQRARAEVPAAQFAGRTAVVAARAQGPKGRWSEWSNLVRLEVVPALSPPADIRASSAAEGVRLEWKGAPGAAWRVYRRSARDEETTLVGKSAEPRFVDASAVFGTAYTYLVQTTRPAGAGEVEPESEISAPVAFTPRDEFPPAVPVNLTAIMGIQAIELTWDRSNETDLKAWRVYRGLAGSADAAMERLAEVTTPSYSDRAVESGKRYRYQVSSLDQAGNESARSAAVEAAAPEK